MPTRLEATVAGRGPVPAPTRVLEVVGADDAAHRRALVEIVARYKAAFRQESVLVTQAPIRACL